MLKPSQYFPCISGSRLTYVSIGFLHCCNVRVVRLIIDVIEPNFARALMSARLRLSHMLAVFSFLKHVLHSAPAGLHSTHFTCTHRVSRANWHCGAKFGRDLLVTLLSNPSFRREMGVIMD